MAPAAAASRSTSWTTGRTLTGSLGNDSFEGHGIREGLGGDDLMRAIQRQGDETPRDRAVGAGGNDDIRLASDAGIALGGMGDDSLMALRGEQVLRGGAGADNFVFGNFERRPVSGPGTDDSLRAVVRDVEAADRLVFAMAEADYLTGAPLPGATRSLADVFGPGTLADLDRFDLDGFDWRVKDLDGATDRIVRTSRTADDDQVVRERILLDGVDLADIDLAQVLLMG